MLPKKFRLPVQGFPRQAKTVFRDKYFTIKIAENPLSHNRAGVLISKASVKKSTQRNLLRRRVLDFFRLKKNFIKLGESSGKDLLIIASPAIINLTKEDLETELANYGKFV